MSSAKLMPMSRLAENLLPTILLTRGWCGAASGNGQRQQLRHGDPAMKATEGSLVQSVNSHCEWTQWMVSNNRTKWRCSWKAMDKYGKIIYKWWNLQLTMFDYRRIAYFGLSQDWLRALQ
jgi:hypothetical protein